MSDPCVGRIASRARRAFALSVLGMVAIAVSCGRADPSRPKVFELRDVVGPALAAAIARAPIAEPTTGTANPEAVEAVLGTLDSPDSRLRGLALADAKALGDPAVAAFATVLADSTAPPARRTAAAQALGAIATRASTAVLVHDLEAVHEPWLRAQCAWQLREAQLDEVIPGLADRLKYEIDGNTVIWIADALASFDNFSGVEALRVLRNTHSDPDVRGAAAERLAALASERGFADGEALYDAWYRGDPEGRLPARTPSDALRREAWWHLSRLVEWDLRTVDDARFALVHMESWVVPLLVESLHDRDVYTRVHAAQCLGRRGPRARAAVPELVAALTEPSLAPQAAFALGEIGDRAAAVPLEELARSARDVDLRIAAVRALGSAGGPSSLEGLRAAWSPDQSIDLRLAAAGSLVRLGEGDSVASFLLECLTSKVADASAAEHALGDWIAHHADAGAAPWTELRRRWRELDPSPTDVPNAVQVAERRAARAAMARAGLAGTAK